MAEKDTAEIPAYTAEELRTRNGGINPDMPSTVADANGSRWAQNGPVHDTSKK